MCYWGITLPHIKWQSSVHCTDNCLDLSIEFFSVHAGEFANQVRTDDNMTYQNCEKQSKFQFSFVVFHWCWLLWDNCEFHNSWIFKHDKFNNVKKITWNICVSVTVFNVKEWSPLLKWLQSLLYLDWLIASSVLIIYVAAQQRLFILESFLSVNMTMLSNGHNKYNVYKRRSVWI